MELVLPNNSAKHCRLWVTASDAAATTSANLNGNAEEKNNVHHADARKNRNRKSSL